MTASAAELLAQIRHDLAPSADENTFVPLVAQGTAPLSVLGILAAEQHHIIASDWRSMLVLAGRSADPAARTFFTTLAQGESLARSKIPALATACGLSPADLAAYQPLPGCQTYPAYMSWLALHAEPAAAILTMLANFTAWGGYCATIAQSLRTHYSFPDDACAFFDFFATPAPEVETQALTAIQSALDTNTPLAPAWPQGRLLQSYEHMFWTTLTTQIR